MENWISKIVSEALSKKNQSPATGVDSSILWYQGFDPKFHQYAVYNGETKVPMVKKSLKMGKKVCEDWASLLWSEKLDVVPDGGSKEELTRRLVDLGFWKNGADAVEVAFGLGISAIAVNIDDLKEDGESDEKTDISIRVFNATNIVPLKWENGNIAEVAFVASDSDVTKLCIHAIVPEGENNEGQYCIINAESRDGNESAVKSIVYSDVPLFCVIQPNIVNNIDLHSPKPIGILSNSIDALKAIDNAYDGLDNEYVLGKKRIFASAKLNKVVYEKTKDGKDVSRQIRTFDTNDAVIYELGENDSADGKPFLWSPNDPLRVDQYLAGINFNLMILGEKTGLGAGYYKFEKGRVMTATQVISENSETFRNVKKHEQLLELSIRRLVKAIVYANNEFTLKDKLPEGEVTIVFDDSIIEDKAEEKKSYVTDLTNGVLSKAEFRAKWYGESEEEAKESIDSMVGDEEIISRFNSLSPVLASGYLTTRLAVSIIFKGREDLLKKSGYSSIDAYIEDVEATKKEGTITAEDLFGMGNSMAADSRKAESSNQTEQDTAPDGDR